MLKENFQVENSRNSKYTVCDNVKKKNCQLCFLPLKRANFAVFTEKIAWIRAVSQNKLYICFIVCFVSVLAELGFESQIGAVRKAVRLKMAPEHSNKKMLV